MTETHAEWHARMRPIWTGERKRTPEEQAAHNLFLITLQTAERLPLSDTESAKLRHDYDSNEKRYLDERA